MKGPPSFFELTRLKANSRWQQLEADPELAGPWHQLFKQVQSPRHVLSELLQNADDAGATKAIVRFEDDVFVFEHNGDDFTDEHFASLCRFGYSNKRNLHTIGFRGIGFKSTFSLGDAVELYTPSLGVRFDRKHFTEPIWISEAMDTQGQTQIRVKIVDQHRRREIEKNLEEWRDSPLSLLFFQSIRHLCLSGSEVEWESLGTGPICDSEWFGLDRNADDSFLLIRSEAESFPEDALQEIRQERLLGLEDDADFPPSRVEIVLGATGGRLYVVLPTGVETGLPFASNAPFIQDPARIKIKDPEISPTNRWLLERAGKLAASAMLAWLKRQDSSEVDRASAYGLLPDNQQDENTLEGVCAATVKIAFGEVIADQPVLLTNIGDLVKQQESVVIPAQMFEIWESGQVAALFDDSHRTPFSGHVITVCRKKLIRWGLLDEIDKDAIIGAIRQKHLPKPATWQKLLNLWAYVAPEITGFRMHRGADELNLVPVQGREALYSAKEVVRLGEKKLLQSDSDWDFLAEYLIVLNQNWPRYLAEQRRRQLNDGDAIEDERLEAAYAVLNKLGLEEASDANEIINQVASQFFSRSDISISDCARLAQIAAKLGATTGESFRFVTVDRQQRSAANVLYDEDGTLEELIPEVQRGAQLLHPDYSAQPISCSREEWREWAGSSRSRLRTFVSVEEKTTHVYGWESIRKEAARRGIQCGLHSHYVTNEFCVKDVDFGDVYWRHWQSSSAQDQFVWIKIVEKLLAQPEHFAKLTKGADILQVATTGNRRSIASEFVVPSWLLKLRSLPCLLDTRGIPRKPDELLRRTPETESLIEVEPFVLKRLDRENTSALLDLLGVRSAPAGPERFIEYLRAFSGADGSPVHEVEKWYRRLDQMTETCSTSDLQKIKDVFRTEKLILAQDGAWSDSRNIFLASDEEDVPDAAIIRPSVSDLSLWRKIGMAERPTIDLVLGWLKTLPSGTVPHPEDAKRVRALMARYPIRIWEECAHWLNLSGEWTQTTELAYALTMQSLVQWKHLHPWVKQKTADFQKLPLDVTANPPFSGLPTLASQIEDRFDQKPLFTGQGVTKEWLKTFGELLKRVEFDRAEDTERVRSEANRLEKTTWHEMPGLEIIPYIDGTPAGTPRRADVVWSGESIYVAPLPTARLARAVPEEINKAFAHPDIKDALIYSYERSREQVREYLEENFKLTESAKVEELPAATESSTEAEQVSSPWIESPSQEAPSWSEVNIEANQAADPDIEKVNAEFLTEIETLPNGAQDSHHRPLSIPRPPQPSLIELFAKANGFQKDGSERFFHPDGSWIGKGVGTAFPWERYNAAGELVRYYLLENHCLEEEPLELKADVWGLLDHRPDLYALILKRLDSTPVEITGASLLAMRDSGEITLYPARYRIVREANVHE